MQFAPLPRRSRIAERPQTARNLFGFFLQGDQRFVAVKMRILPCHAAADLFGIHIQTIQAEMRDHAPVFVHRLAGHLHLLAQHHGESERLDVSPKLCIFSGASISASRTLTGWLPPHRGRCRVPGAFGSTLSQLRNTSKVSPSSTAITLPKKSAASAVPPIKNSRAHARQRKPFIMAARS